MLIRIAGLTNQMSVFSMSRDKDSCARASGEKRWRLGGRREEEQSDKGALSRSMTNQTARESMQKPPASKAPYLQSSTQLP